LTVIALVPSFLAAIAALVLSGLAWMAVTSTLQAELQLMLPAWVRARGVAVYMVTFTGAQTGGALLWGLVANRVGLVPAILAAAIVVLAAALAGLLRRVPETGHLDPQPSTGPTRG
jgi:MFS family permease